MKCPRDAQSDEMSGSRNVVQETAAYLVDATEAAEGLDTPHTTGGGRRGISQEQGQKVAWEHDDDFW